MTPAAVQIDSVSKTYRIYAKPIDRIKESLLRKPFHRSFEGLKNISLSIPAGSTMGIVGENGAGKSTLLNIIAGTLAPSGGVVNVTGRMAALLELGAGFNMEFTGRENILLNASLLGLTGTEIREKEASIIDFAELDAFIDLPLKTYSSGMVVRLGFSIATGVDPDILVIDEALSVGDQYFQEKCIDWMTGFQRRGKTLLFCSHAIYLVNKLCSRAIWLDQGSIQATGQATTVTAAYENHCRQKKATSAAQPESSESAPVKICSIRLNNQEGPITLNTGEDLNIDIEYESMTERSSWITAGIRRNDDLICHAVSMAHDLPKPLKGKGRGRARLRYPALPLLHGEFTIVVTVLDKAELRHFGRMDSAPFRIAPPIEWRSEVGLIDLDHKWTLL